MPNSSEQFRIQYDYTSAKSSPIEFMNLTLSQKGLILIVVPIVVQTICFAFWYRDFAGIERTLQATSASAATTSEIKDIQRELLNAALSLESYDPSADKSSHALRGMKGAVWQIRTDFEHFRQSLTPSQKSALGDSSIDSVQQQLDRQLMHLDEAYLAATEQDNGRMHANMASMLELNHRFNEQVDKLTKKFPVAAEDVARQQASLRAVIQQDALVVAVLSAFITLALAWYFRRETMSRFQTLSENANRFAAGNALLPPLSGSDEFSKLDEIFRNMVAKISQSDRQKQDYLAMMAHDLRAPLSAVDGALTVLSSEGLGETIPERSLELLCRTQANVERLIDLISELLDLETLQSGKMILKLDCVPLAYIFEVSWEGVRQLSDAKDVHVILPETDVELIADDDRLVQVFTNLLVNAIKYSPLGGTITVSITEPSESLIEVRVKDEGPGIPPDKLTTIFNKFVQSQKTTINSWGLGLAICKEIIELHKGTLGVESELGKGATFWFCLPYIRGGSSIQLSTVSKPASKTKAT